MTEKEYTNLIEQADELRKKIRPISSLRYDIESIERMIKAHRMGVLASIELRLYCEHGDTLTAVFPSIKNSSRDHDVPSHHLIFAGLEMYLTELKKECSRLIA